MEPFFARPRPDWPIVTPLHADHFCSALEEAGILNEFLDVVHGLTYGFPMNSTIIVNFTHISPNYSSALEHRDVIDTMIIRKTAFLGVLGSSRECEDFSCEGQGAREV